MRTLVAHMWLIKHVQYYNLKYVEVQQLFLVLHSLSSTTKDSCKQCVYLHMDKWTSADIVLHSPTLSYINLKKSFISIHRED